MIRAKLIFTKTKVMQQRPPQESDNALKKTTLPTILVSYILSNLFRHFGLPDKGVGYQKCQASSPDGHLIF